MWISRQKQSLVVGGAGLFLSVSCGNFLCDSRLPSPWQGSHGIPTRTRHCSMHAISIRRGAGIADLEKACRISLTTDSPGFEPAPAAVSAFARLARQPSAVMRRGLARVRQGYGGGMPGCGRVPSAAVFSMRPACRICKARDALKSSTSRLGPFGADVPQMPGFQVTTWDGDVPVRKNDTFLAFIH